MRQCISIRLSGKLSHVLQTMIFSLHLFSSTSQEDDYLGSNISSLFFHICRTTFCSIQQSSMNNSEYVTSSESLFTHCACDMQYIVLQYTIKITELQKREKFPGWAKSIMHRALSSLHTASVQRIYTRMCAFFKMKRMSLFMSLRLKQQPVKPFP